MCQDCCCAVTDFIHKGDGSQINQQLQSEIDGNEHGDFGQRDLILGLKRQEKQGNKVIYNSLGNIAAKTGIDCFFIFCGFFCHKYGLLNIFVFDKCLTCQTNQNYV